MRVNHPLLKIAQNQSGLFTSQQAIESGIDSRNHSYHLKRENWSRVKRGIYQLNFVQTDSKKDFFLFQLWARNRNGEQVGTYSHETALYLMNFKMNCPVKLHITVPDNFRRIANNNQLILHYENLHTSEKLEKNGLHITNIRKTFQDLISSGAYPPEWIKQKLKIAIEKKIISLEEIKTISVHNDTEQIFNAILFELSD